MSRKHKAIKTTKVRQKFTKYIRKEGTQKIYDLCKNVNKREWRVWKYKELKKIRNKRSHGKKEARKLEGSITKKGKVKTNMLNDIVLRPKTMKKKNNNVYQSVKKAIIIDKRANSMETVKFYT